MTEKKPKLVKKLARECLDAVREFPLALSCLALAVLCASLPDINWQTSWSYGSAAMLACMGSLAGSLLSHGKSRAVKWLLQIIAFIIAWLYLWVFNKSGYFAADCFRTDNQSEISGSFYAWWTVLSVVIVYPFWFKNDTRAVGSWSVTMRGLTGLLRGGLVSLCVLIAMVIITGAGNVLLDIEIFGQFWLTFIPLMLFGMLGISAFSAKRTTDAAPFRLAAFSRGVFTFVSVPLLAIYLLIFYLYLVKVLVSGATPIRDLSYQAAGVFTAFCAQRYIFHKAIVEDGDNTVALWFNRLSPVLLFLPVFMVSWVLGQRLMRYGITVSRLYLLLANLWMYVVLIWWFLTKGRKIWFIPVSFATLFFFSSALLPNVSSLTEAVMRGNLKKALESAGCQLPVSELFLNETSWQILDQKERSTLAYMFDTMGESSLQGIVSFSDEWKRHRSCTAGLEKRMFISLRCRSSFDEIPQGCTGVDFHDYSLADISLKGDSLILNLKDAGALIMSVESLERLQKQHSIGDNAIKPVAVCGDVRGASLTYFYISAAVREGKLGKSPYASFSGTVFLRKKAAARFILME